MTDNLLELVTEQATTSEAAPDRQEGAERTEDGKWRYPPLATMNKERAAAGSDPLTTERIKTMTDNPTEVAAVLPDNLENWENELKETRIMAKRGFYLGLSDGVKGLVSMLPTLEAAARRTKKPPPPEIIKLSKSYAFKTAYEAGLELGRKVLDLNSVIEALTDLALKGEVDIDGICRPPEDGLEGEVEIYTGTSPDSKAGEQQLEIAEQEANNE